MMRHFLEEPAIDESFLGRLREITTPVEHRRELVDHAVNLVADKRIVMLGESTHGTADYYQLRAQISERLIKHHHFNFVAVEGDWPAAFAVNLFVKHFAKGQTAKSVMQLFNRWPTWMWANMEAQQFFEWLHVYNYQRPIEQRAGFYGLDVYSLSESLTHLMINLMRRFPAAYPSAKAVLDCFHYYGGSGQNFARAAALTDASCEQQVITMLSELRKATAKVEMPFEQELNLIQNAEVIRNAENYYRCMIRPGPDSWNVRDHHMMATLDKLLAHFGADAKAIVWAHNTHIGDARFTDMADNGTTNIGELARRRYGEQGVGLIGFATNDGNVVAARSWGGIKQILPIPNARPNSWEHCLHRHFNRRDLFVRCPAILDHSDPLYVRRGQRAIGVIYHPEYEAMGNYVPSQLTKRYDALIYLDSTNALHPLRITVKHDDSIPDTFPSAI